MPRISMFHAFRATLLLTAAVLLSVAGTAVNAQSVLYAESFEYANQAALEAEWPRPPESGVTDFWSQPIKTTTFLSPPDGTRAVFTAGDHYSRNDDLGILGSHVTKVSYDVRLDTGVGVNASSVFEMWEIGTVYPFDTLQGSILAPNFDSGDYELHFLRPDALPANAQPLGLSLADGEWNTIEMTIAANGDRNFSLTNSGGTSVSGVTNSDYDNQFINAIVIADQDPLPFGAGGASYLDNIVIEGTSTPATEFNWIETGSVNWNPFTNWTRNGTGNAPSSAEHTAIFGSAITKDSTVAVDAPVTLNRLEFDDDNTYAIAGLGTITLQADPTAVLPTVAVAQGNHQLQVKLALADDTGITVSGGSLDLNNEVDLNGNTLTLSGTVNINHSTIGGGTVVSLGALGTEGSASVAGDLTSAGTLAFDLGEDGADSFNVSGSATLSGILDVELDPGYTPRGSYTVLTAGSLSAGGLALDPSDRSLFSLSTVGNSLVLSAVPEPSAMALLFVGAIGLSWSTRRQRPALHQEVLPRTRIPLLHAFRATLLLTAAVLLSVGPTAVNATEVLYAESFEYADEAELDAAWEGVPPAWWSDNLELNSDPSLVSDGTKSAILRETTASMGEYVEIPIGPLAGQLGYGILARDAELEFTSGVVVESVSFDVYIDTANGYLPHWIFELWEVTVGTYNGGTYTGALGVHAPSWGTGPENLELKMVTDDTSLAWTGFGIDVVDGEWNTIKLDIDSSGNRTASITTASGGTVVGNTLNHWAGSTNLNALQIHSGWSEIGDAVFDNIVIEGLPDPNAATVFTWNSAGAGYWDLASNWSFTGPGNHPGKNSHTAIFGSAITQPTTVVVASTYTVNRIELDNANSYAIGGTGTVKLEADPDGPDPTVEVAQGNHQFQAKLAMVDDTGITVSSGSLDLNNEIDLNGNTLTLSGTVNINHSTIDGGTVTSSGVLGTAGSTSIGGDLTSTGTLAIDLGAFNTDFFDVAGNATLSGILDVTLEGGFTPAGNYTVLTAGSLSAGGLALDPSDTSTFSLNIVGNSLVLSAAAGTDADGNGIVDGADFLILQRDNPSLIPQWQLDYGGPPSIGTIAAAVPEPSALALAMLAGLGVLMTRR